MNGQVHRPLMGVSIRAAGLATLGLSWICGHELWRLHSMDGTSALTFFLALVTFLAASAGSAMLIVGQHLFDEVEISQRWARRPVVHDSMSGEEHDFRR